MRWLRRGCVVTGVAVLLSALSAHAHLIVSQRGTLNMVASGVYMVLSLPVSAFTGIDDDQDGMLSVEELRRHAIDIQTQVSAGVELKSNQKAYPLEGLMLNTVPTDAAPNAPAPQIAVLGYFAVEPDATGLRFAMRIFGTQPHEQSEHISVTRGSQTQLMTLTPANHRRDLFPSVWRAFSDQVGEGMAHILSGWDHLLFLLVVLSSGWGFRRLVLALSCFTAGHAISLTASVLLGLEASSTWVEPAIAATIVGTAVFDRWSFSRDRRPSAWVSLLLVFACSLVHGLGLAGALAGLGIDPIHKALTLTGFNVGIELGQLLVAVLASFTLKFVAAAGGSAWANISKQAVSYAAIAIGLYWFFSRI